MITGDNITNYTKKESRRVDLVFGVPFRDDIDNVKRVVWEVLKGDERILADPPPTGVVLELGESKRLFRNGHGPGCRGTDTPGHATRLSHRETQ